MIQMTPKECAMLKELKGAEQLCIDKYNRHSSQARDPQLKNLFTQLAQTEQKHLDTLCQLEEGKVPAMGSASPLQMSFQAKYSGECSDKQGDCFLCTDALSGEKHTSGLYDTSIFEFTDEGQRNALNNIQKQEQNHGKLIYDYMAVNNMYS